MIKCGIMRTVDHVSLYFGFLLAFQVLLKCESCRHERSLRYGTDTLTPSGLGTKAHPNGHHSRDGEAKIPGSCFLCKVIVRGLKNYVRGQVARISKAQCGKFSAKGRNVCQRKTANFKYRINKKLFSDNAKTMCKKIKAC